jgi:UDP-2,4-diacetamido-2,4,6-trideoxy-beta-L-altropyranose hydrolase
MENLKVIILTEGSKYIGFGHITRCLSLYQAFEENNISPKFIMNGDETITELVKNTNYEIFDWIENKNKFLENIKGSDIVIIDSYLANREFYEELSKIVKTPVYIDDNKRIDYQKGIVVNGNIHAFNLKYPTKEGVIYLLGTEYIPLRREFREVPEKEIKEKVKSIMITFGGDDIRNMTPKVLKLLIDNYPNLIKNVVVGKGFKKIEEIKYLENKNTNLTFNASGEQMKNLMLNCDIVISAGGQTLYELARVGVPTIAVGVAENQLVSVKGWQKAGFIEYAGCWEDGKVFDRIREALDKLKNVKTRNERKKIGKALIDGKGSKRIIEFLKNKSKTAL